MLISWFWTECMCVVSVGDILFCNRKETARSWRNPFEQKHFLGFRELIWIFFDEFWIISENAIYAWKFPKIIMTEGNELNWSNQFVCNLKFQPHPKSVPSATRNGSKTDSPRPAPITAKKIHIKVNFCLFFCCESFEKGLARPTFMAFRHCRKEIQKRFARMLFFSWPKQERKLSSTHQMFYHIN
jgi:hypothetical protein